MTFSRAAPNPLRFSTYLFDFMIFLKNLVVDCLLKEAEVDKCIRMRWKASASIAIAAGVYLVLLRALLQPFQLVVEHRELSGDAFYPSMQSSVLAVLRIEIVLIPLALLWRADL